MSPAAVGQAGFANLLANPADVALIRDLYAHARSVNAKHRTYWGSSFGGREHKWQVGPAAVSVFDGTLYYTRHGELILTANLTSPRELAQRLAAIGVLPQRFTGGEPRHLVDEEFEVRKAVAHQDESDWAALVDSMRSPRTVGWTR